MDKDKDKDKDDDIDAGCSAAPKTTLWIGGTVLAASVVVALVIVFVAPSKKSSTPTENPPQPIAAAESSGGQSGDPMIVRQCAANHWILDCRHPTTSEYDACSDDPEGVLCCPAGTIKSRKDALDAIKKGKLDLCACGYLPPGKENECRQ